MIFSPISRRMAALLRVTAVVLLLIAGGSAQAPALALGLPDLGDASGSDLPISAERRIGESIMRDIRLREPTYLDDPEVESYLNELGQRLASHAEEVGGSYRFFAIDDASVNAFAMFGGFIGVNTGLVLSSQTESELAAVLAHEVSHVSQRHLARQMAKGKQATLTSVLAIALAVIAARSNADVIGATLAATEAGNIQAQLAFTRDFEREADRVGFELLDKAGFDVHGMSQFFDRLHRSSRVYENGAPVYLRSHPMTIERMSDMENRSAQTPFRQVPGSLDFALIKAKLQARLESPRDALVRHEELVRERRFVSEPAARYGLALVLARNEKFADAEREIEMVVRLGGSSAIIERFAAELRGRQGDLAGSVARYESALKRYPSASALRYGYAEAMLAANNAEAARRFLADAVMQYPGDPKLVELLARTYAALGRLGGQHRARAELYVLNGQLPAAIEQLQMGQRVKGLDFYEQSAIDARLRELKALLAEELSRQRPRGQ
jgi:predicted Zn-dependent protease